MTEAARTRLSAETAELLERRQRVLGAPYRLFYEQPLHIVRGDGALLYDAQGLDYLDAYNNVPVVGHSNARVYAAVSAQLSTLNTHTRYLTEAVVAYAERLADLFPSSLTQVMFGCSGSEAVDLALRIATCASGRSGIVVTRNAYHGTTRATAEVSPSLGPRNPIPAHVVLVEAPDPVRDDAGGDLAFRERVVGAIAELRARGHLPAALLVDSIMSSDGVVPAPGGWLAEAASVIRGAGGLYIADEVQAGFLRTGSHWWGFQHYDIQPDLVVMGKPMGNGLPISAVVGRRDVLDTFAREARYFNTFGGNPVSIAAATAVLDEIDDLCIAAQVERVGTLLLDETRSVCAGDERLLDVRGSGLFLAVEVVTDRESKTPDPELAATIVNRLRDRRVLISTAGRYGNVLKIRPPLVFSDAHVDRLVSALKESLRP